MNRMTVPVVIATALTAFSGCDSMKKMIDPTGNAYAKPGDTAKPAANATTNKTSTTGSTSTTTAPSAPAPSRSPGQPFDAPIREKAVGRILTTAVVESQIDDINFQARGRSFRFQKGIFHDRTGITSLRDSSGRFWGVAIGDLNMDGSDDAVLVLRTDRANAPVAWDLAYLPNRSGRLFNVQTLALPGDQGFRDVVIEGSSVMLVPAVDGSNVHLGYSGGELSFVAR